MAQDDKLWTQPALYALAKAAALEAIQSQGGLALPCRVIALNPNNPATGEPLGYSFVQVQFEVNIPYTEPDGTTGTYTLPPLILPKAEGQWIRSSTQIGDLGMTQALDTSHGGVSGMSPGVPNTGTAYGNLSTLVFVPVGNSGFGAAPDPDKPWVNGPAGAVSSDTAQTATHVIAVPTYGTPGTITQTIHNPAGAGASTVTHLLDGVNNAITQALSGSTGTLTTIVDGNGNAISHVVPTGAKIGLGNLASTLGSARAVPAQADLTTLANNLISQSLQTMSAAIGAAAVTAGIPNASAFHSILAASGFISGLSGIDPTIPGCSSKVFVDS